MEEPETAREPVRQARSRGVTLTREHGLLMALTKTVVQTAPVEEMSEHLGYDEHEISAHFADVYVHRDDAALAAPGCSGLGPPPRQVGDRVEQRVGGHVAAEVGR